MSARFKLEETIDDTEAKSLWVFGYGSLCWRPGFEFDKAVVGHIKGFSRRFWQGNKVHRGTSQKPGRVATLIEDHRPSSAVYGVAFSISGQNAISYLSQRECKMGGYDTKFTTFYPPHGAPIRTVLLYVAVPGNPSWLGDAPLSDMAAEITEGEGQCGHNVEYLLRLADFMRQHCPEGDDAHLFDLEKLVIDRIRAKKICISSLMGTGKDCINFQRIRVASPIDNELRTNDSSRLNNCDNNFQFTATVSSKKLLCLNI